MRFSPRTGDATIKKKIASPSQAKNRSCGRGLRSRGNKCHLMAKSFLREKIEPTIFGIWPVSYSYMNLDHLESGVPRVEYQKGLHF